MKCVICKNGETEMGQSVITLTRDNSVIVVKKVPAEVCQNCGEKYISQEIVKKLMPLADDSLQKGVVVDVRDYKAA